MAANPSDDPFDYERPAHKSIFLISPVRGINDEEKRFLNDYVKQVETATGKGIHYPLYDVDQDDSIGLRILSDNRAAMRRAESVEIFYNPTSQGSMFDLGMAFIANKPLRVINPGIGRRDDDPVARFLRWYALKQGNSDDIEDMLAKNGRAKQIRGSATVPLRFNGLAPEFLFDFGMVFMASKPIVLLNYDEVQPPANKTGKCFERVLRAMHEEYLQDYYKR